MKNVTVSLESLDKKIDSKIDFLDKRIDSLDKKLDSKIDSKFSFLNDKIDSGLHELRQQYFDLMNFLKEHMMMRGEVEQQIDTKFSTYTSDQFEFQDRVGKRTENTEQENLAMRYEVDEVKERITLVEKRVGI